MVVDISCLTVFKMAALYPLGFLKFLIFKWPLRSGVPVSTSMQNCVIIGQYFGGITIFQYLRWRPSDMLDFKKFSFWPRRRWDLGARICITIPNFIKIGQTVTDMSYLKFFSCHLEFFFNIWIFQRTITFDGPICVKLKNYVKIGGIVLIIFIHQIHGRKQIERNNT